MVLQGPDKGRRFELPDAPTLIGRESRQLPLTDNTVSRRHCEIVPMDDQNWYLKDLGSSNGTYVNGLRVRDSQPLHLGDQIRIGRTLMVFGAQPGVSRTSSSHVRISGEEVGLDSSIMHTVPSNDDSMVLAVPEPAAAAMSNLKILYQLGAALGSSFNIDQILEVVMDLVFEHVKAERGIILMHDPGTKDLVPKVVRTREEGDPKHGVSETTTEKGDGQKGEKDEPEKPIKIHASRTIINYVTEHGEGVLSSNAMADQRFSKGKSVHNMGIRSALCVPIKSRKLPDKDKAGDEIFGVIYIDSSVRNYTYSPDQLRLLTAIGLQAGMAIQNAKLYLAGLQAERMAAIGETTAALSHSIKNILQALRGGADVVEMGIGSNNITQAKKGWDIVSRNLDKILNLTMNLLAYSKEREPNVELVSPVTVISECIELIQQTANDKGAKVIPELDKDHPPIAMDPAGMHQVVMNLLSNALDAVEENQGVVRVACRLDASRSESIIEVIDNGVGIPPTLMKHMFELFHSTKGNRGTGLGLAVARKIVEEHEGIITAQSKPGEGTIFTIRLPAHQAVPQESLHQHTQIR